MSKDNVRSILILLKTCTKNRDLRNGSRVHEDIRKKGLLEKSLSIGTALVHMYAKCGDLWKARLVFNELPVQNVVSWTALIGGYAHYGRGEEALSCVEQMQLKGLSPDALTYTCLLKACSNAGAAQKGSKIHAEIVKHGMLGSDIVLGTALVDMYAKCNALSKAQQVFDELPAQNTITWNALISGYCQQGRCEEALSCFQRMRCYGFSPDSLTFSCVLKACGYLGAVDMGRKIHEEILREGLLTNNNMLGNALVDMYAKCGDLVKAQCVFDDLTLGDVIGFTSLIAGYDHHGHGEEALKCFRQMRNEGLSADAMSLACILGVCGSICATEVGKEIHAEIAKGETLVHDTVLGNALVDMYAKCGTLAMAQQVFDEISVRDIISWTALISGYEKHGHAEKTLSCFQRMQLEGLYPNSVTFCCLLQACGSLGAIEKGKELHTELVREGLLGEDSMVGHALVDMYAKCGDIVKAEEVFYELPVRGVVAWTTLIAGYSHLGMYEAVFSSLNEMVGEGIEPNAITFLIVLSACSSSGLVDEGQMCFEAMTTAYGIAPTVQHYTCMIDLFGRGGHFDKAVSMVGKMPSADYLPAWLALLGACQKWGKLMVGKLAFEHAVRLDGKCAVAYDLMSSIYLDAGMQENVAMVEGMRKENNAGVGGNPRFLMLMQE